MESSLCFASLLTDEIRTMQISFLLMGLTSSAPILMELQICFKSVILGGNSFQYSEINVV